jgi:signal transduction histidine kinase
VAHVFLAVALALPLVAAVAATVMALLVPSQSMLNRGLLAVLGAGFLTVVAWVALLPEVRSVEVATARTLLALDLPDVTHPGDWGSRRRGASWLVVLVVLGLVVATGLLYLLPTGVGLLAHPFGGDDTIGVPGGTFSTGSGWDAAWLVLPGLLALAASGALVQGSGVLLRHLAPRVIGPTVVERVAVAARRERELARANALARDLHDSLGHRLTAMTVQASAARRLLRTDPGAAERAMAAVEDLGRSAQADVDEVVGALRGRAPSGDVDPESTSDVVEPLRSLLERHPAEVRVCAPPSLLLSGPVAETVVAVAREALTNASRHGVGPVDLQLGCAAGAAVLEVRNAVAPRSSAGSASSGRSGLRGLRERVLLDGGTLTAGIEEEGTWLLRATLPTA